MTFVTDVEKISAEINPQVVAWRRDFHKNPELGNRETRTSKIIGLGYRSEPIRRPSTPIRAWEHMPRISSSR